VHFAQHFTNASDEFVHPADGLMTEINPAADECHAPDQCGMVT
jgi:hypothetical protein